MGTDSSLWSLAAWVVDAFSDPELLIVFVAGIAALVGFRVAARVRALAAREDARPADDLI
jgi:hypothetical protein